MNAGIIPGKHAPNKPTQQKLKSGLENQQQQQENNVNPNMTSLLLQLNNTRLGTQKVLYFNRVTKVAGRTIKLLIQQLAKLNSFYYNTKIHEKFHNVKLNSDQEVIYTLLDIC